jgi:hypothetical protein
LPRRLTIGGSGLAMVVAWVVSGRLGLLALSSPEWSRILVAATVLISGLAAIWICRWARPNTSPAYVR